jgi:hypothetical protein
MHFVKFFWLLSALIFLIVLGVTYMYLPEPVNLSFGQADYEHLRIQRMYYFYGSALGCLFINALLLVFGKLMTPWRLFILPNRAHWQGESHYRRIFSRKIGDWFKGLALIINVFLIYVLLAVYVQHDPNVNYNPIWFLVLCVLALPTWIGMYFMIFSQKES